MCVNIIDGGINDAKTNTKQLDISILKASSVSLKLKALIVLAMSENVSAMGK